MARNNAFALNDDAGRQARTSIPLELTDSLINRFSPGPDGADSHVRTRNDTAESEYESFKTQVYEMISLIPYGRVTTYGAIARGAGKPRGARQIGWLLRTIPPELELPCHRIVNSQGFLSGGWNFGHPDVMRALLQEEGVPFLGEYRVAIEYCLWLPEDFANLPTANEVDDFHPVAGG